MKVENDKVIEKDYLDLLDISVEVGEEENNQLFQWVRTLHLYDEVKNFDPWIATHAREFGVDVDWVLFEEVHSESSSKDIGDSFEGALNFQPLVDSTNVGQSNRPSTSSYDSSRNGTNDGDDNAGNAREHVGQQSWYPISPFTCEDYSMHCTQDEDRENGQWHHLMRSYFQSVLSPWV